MERSLNILRSTRSPLSPFLQYLLGCSQGAQSQLPPLAELAGQLGISLPALREQMEVARDLGLIEVRPRTGMQLQPFQFSHAFQTGLSYAMASGSLSFDQIADLRTHLESAYWKEAAARLEREDLEGLRRILQAASQKLAARPPQIPHEEHKAFHLAMYCKLPNPLVVGLLELYWQAYEAMGLDVYNDLDYLRSVWKYHQQSVEAISRGEIAAGYQSFREHLELISRRPNQKAGGHFE